MSATIFVLRNGQQSGPYTAGQVREMVGDGSLQPSDMAWREGLPEWKALSDVVPGIGPASQAAAASVPQAVPAVAAVATGGAMKWGLAAGATAIVLVLGGVGAWQYNAQQEIAAEKQRLAREEQKRVELQAEEQQRRQLEEKRKADEELQRLAEEKKQAEARNQELEQRLADERRVAEEQRVADQERRLEQQRERQQRVYETRRQRPTNEFPNQGSPYGGGYVQNPTMAPPPPVCRECGVVQSVRAVGHQGQGSGVGAVAGGVVGGALGNQIGRGRGRNAATVVGVLGGAVAGHEIEKSQRSYTTYEISVRFDDGGYRTFAQDAPPPWRQGDRVRMINGTLAGY